MVETSVADIVAGTVATDNPLAALGEEVAEVEQCVEEFAILHSCRLDIFDESLAGGA